MKILVTGAKGFVGKNLCETLKTIQDGRNRTRSISIEELYEYDRDTDPALLETFVKNADFIFHLAGINRPKELKEFKEGNFDLTVFLLNIKKQAGNSCPIMLSSSIHAGVFEPEKGEVYSAYGETKRLGEEAMFSYGQECGVKVLVYRFPNLFGKWCRPNYNSVTATFCHNVANGLPIQVNNPATELNLVYIDDLVNEMLDALEGNEHHCDYEGLNPIPNATGRYCYVPVSHRVTLGEMADLLYQFADTPNTLLMPPLESGSFAKKLYSTYLSYLPEEKTVYDLPMKSDERGSFTELLKTSDHGQFSVNISKPGMTKGQHWHHSKWELFIVVSGHALIQERKIGSDEVMEFEVSGDHIRAVQMLPGYTHNIINLSDTEDLVTLMWANELFDPDHPDTYFEKVV